MRTQRRLCGIFFSLFLTLFVSCMLYTTNQIKGDPRHMTVGEEFWMSSSIYWIRFRNLFLLTNLLFKYNLINFTIIMTPTQYILSTSLSSNKLSNYGIWHLKLIINCHVSWDTLYLTKINRHIFRNKSLTSHPVWATLNKMLLI